MMTETKLDDIDDLTFPGFKLITKNRKHKKRASGFADVLTCRPVVGSSRE